MFSTPESSTSNPTPEAEEPGHLAADVDDALGGPHDPRQHLEERALAGAVRPDHGQRLAVVDLEVDVAEGPEALRRLARDDVRERLAEGRLAGEAEVVPDPQIVDRDRVAVATLPGRGNAALAHRTLAKSGSTRLKKIDADGQQEEAPEQEEARAMKSGSRGSSPFGPP